jgi:hypothetical protein
MLGTLKPILQIVGFTNEEIKGGIFGKNEKKLQISSGDGTYDST